MANVYVGPSSAGSANGTSWANRYGTLNAAEDRPLSAGDVVYVGPGTYRELLTVDVSGTAGNPITYIGDYTGANTDGVGGIVRITGAANETTTGTRASCISASAKNYRTFRGFLMDGASTTTVAAVDPVGWIIDQCVFVSATTGNLLLISGASQLGCAVSNCVFTGRVTANALAFSHSATVDNTGHVVTSCLFLSLGRGTALAFPRVGGILAENCTINSADSGVAQTVNPAAGQTNTVNNTIITGCNIGVSCPTLGFLVEDYCALYNNGTTRSNVATGANSVAYPPGFDTRPFFEAMNAGTLVLPLVSLASYSGLVEYSAGTGAPSTDWRGHVVAGSLREWGVEEYVSTYGVEAGGGVTMWPLSQSFIQGIIGAG